MVDWCSPDPDRFSTSERTFQSLLFTKPDDIEGARWPFWAEARIIIGSDTTDTGMLIAGEVHQAAVNAVGAWQVDENS